MKPLTLIFDLDDTIIESFPGYVKLHKTVAADLGWRVPDEEEFIAYGPTWEDTVARIWPNADLTPFFARAEEVIESIVYGPIQGALHALATLRQRGHPLFIVTKRSSKHLALRLRQAGIQEHWFDGIFPADHGPAAKPDPRCFEPVWSKMGWSPSEHQEGDDARAVYVGDRAEDQLAAKRAQIPFIAVLTGPESRQGFPKPGAAHVLPSIEQLPALLSAPDTP